MHRIILQITVLFNDFFYLFLSFIDPLFKASPNGKYSNLTFSIAPGLYPKSSLVKYSYLPNSSDNNAEILVASLCKSY